MKKIIIFLLISFRALAMDSNNEAREHETRITIVCEQDQSSNKFNKTMHLAAAG